MAIYFVLLLLFFMTIISNKSQYVTCDTAIISNQDSINSVSDESDPNVQLEVKEDSSDQNETDKIERLLFLVIVIRQVFCSRKNKFWYSNPFVGWCISVHLLFK